MQSTTLKLACALAAVIVCLPAPAPAQELRKDSVWNGVVVGAAIGGGLGVTPGVALAYAVMAAGLLAVERFGSLSIAHPEPPLAVPAE